MRIWSEIFLIKKRSSSKPLTDDYFLVFGTPKTAKYIVLKIFCAFFEIFDWVGEKFIKKAQKYRFFSNFFFENWSL